ncbi:hypothetical protein I3842_13G122400 [Carya illinoinensis]|uniref:Vacuolar protein sorting-associated protein 62 n=1 Tax=Carya illinoinensis TaxID=32201 RepID=A0A922D710_CARIL|nr:hypothetical protein I3842_13G122400 [Carya illinoinensis]
MGNRTHILPSSTANNLSKKRSEALHIETMFRLPSPLLVWPKGQGFATGIMDLGGGLHVCQLSTLDKVWATHEGGPDNLGATFFEPSRIPDGFSMLGCYSQPNNKPFFGWVLVGKDDGSSGALRKPLDYTLIWSSESSEIKRDGNGYVWLPIPPEGYKAIGHVVTNSPQKPFLDKIRCVRADLTNQCEADSWIWGPGKASYANGFSVYNVRPSIRGVNALGVSVGTFVAQLGGIASPLSIACLKNAKSNLSSMPNLMQIDALMRAYSPWVYFHPDEEFLPSSMRWFFVNGALLYSKGEESKPVPIEPNGSNLPQGGSNDGAYWLDLPVDAGAKERVKKGDLGNSQVYVHVKPMLGASFTDLAIWMFYPFNGPSKAKVGIVNVSLGKIGEHVGDWEHVTLRVSNFNGELQRVYFSEHNGGTWLEAYELEFQNGNKTVAYASLHGHALYPKAGLVLQGSGGIGIRNDTGKSKMMMDIGGSYSVVAAEYLGSAIIEPAWLKYCRKWGPKISYDIADEIRKVERALPGPFKSAFNRFVRGLPNEVLGEEGPTGPNMKNNWTQDEV